MVALKEETNIPLKVISLTDETLIHASQGSKDGKIHRPHLVTDTVELTPYGFEDGKAHRPHLVTNTMEVAPQMFC